MLTIVVNDLLSVENAEGMRVYEDTDVRHRDCSDRRCSACFQCESGDELDYTVGIDRHAYVPTGYVDTGEIKVAFPQVG